MTETIQQLKEDIALLQMKLQKLEETQMTLEKSGEFSIVSYNGETYYRTLYDVVCGGWYKTDTNGEVFYLVEDETERKLEKLYHEQVVVKEPEENEWRTVALRFGEKLSAIGPCGYYDFSPGEWVEWALNAYEKNADDYLRLLKKGKEKEQKWDVVRESVKWCEEHREESVEDYLKPHTPDKIEENLREAFKKVQQTEEWKETQRKIDSNYDDMVKNPPEFLKFELGKTLEGLIEEWWCDVFTRNSDLSMEESIDCLVTMICYWLPKEQSAAGSQNVDTELLVDGYNDALTKIKSKLRNKK